MKDSISVTRFPLQGKWKAVKSPGHHKYAYDFCAVNARRLYRSKNTFHLIFSEVPADESYSWSQTVYAPVNGTIWEASDGWKDRITLNYVRDIFNIVFHRPKLTLGDIRPFAGNYIVIQKNSTYIFMAHLKEGSLQASTGQTVKTGQPIAKIGNSGYSLMPHLHFQIMNDTDFLKSDILPFHCHYERWNGKQWESVNGERIRKGDTIRNETLPRSMSSTN